MEKRSRTLGASTLAWGVIGILGLLSFATLVWRMFGSSCGAGVM
jgi:hypothetical protein